MGAPVEQLILQLRREIPEKYRGGGRLSVVNFQPEVRDLTAKRQIATVAKDWYTSTIV